MKLYTTVTNSRGKLKGIGSHKIQNVHCRTWTHGVRIAALYDAMGKDKPTTFDLYATGGSNGASSEIFLGQIILKNGKTCFKRPRRGPVGMEPPMS